MRKVRLDLDTLDVQSFQTSGEAHAARRGTVRGAEAVTDPFAIEDDALLGASLLYTCKQTCDPCDAGYGA